MKTFNISINEDQIQTIAAGLGELPHRIAAPLLNHLQDEINKSIALEASTMSPVTGADTDAESTGEYNEEV